MKKFPLGYVLWWFVTCSILPWGLAVYDLCDNKGWGRVAVGFLNFLNGFVWCLAYKQISVWLKQWKESGQL